MKRPSKRRERHSCLHDCRQVLRFIHERGLSVGDKLPSHADLCRELHTCHGTLDAAMKWLIEDGVISRKQRAGSIVESLYPLNPTRTIWRAGIVIPPLDRSYFFPVLAQYLHKHLESRGISDRTYLLSNNAMPGEEVHERHPKDFSSLDEDIEDGMLDIILSATRLVTDRLPLCGAPAWSQSTLGVMINFRQFASETISELRGRGCRHIGVISPADSYTELVDGARKAGSVKDGIECIFSPAGNEHTRRLCAQLLARDQGSRPDGLIFRDDLTAQAFTMALVQQDEYRPTIASLTNLQIPLAFATPVITFAIDIDALAEAAVRIALEKLLKPQMPDYIQRMTATLMVDSSSALPVLIS